MFDTSFRIEEGTFPLLFLYTDKSEFTDTWPFI